MNRIKYNSDVLKIIAMICMLIDHFSQALHKNMLFFNVHWNADKMGNVVSMINWGRRIGRIAFPIFCYLLIQGFYNTSNLKKYIIRVFLCALIAEIPFDLYMSGNWFSLQHQNSVFIFAFGLCMFYLMQKFKWNKFISIIMFMLCGLLCQALCIDYGIYGILLLALFYFIKFHDIESVEFSAVCFIILCGIFGMFSNNQFDLSAFVNGIKFEGFGLVSYLFILLSNGSTWNNKKFKVFSYIFWPCQFLILYLWSLIVFYF